VNNHIEQLKSMSMLIENSFYYKTILYSIPKYLLIFLSIALSTASAESINNDLNNDGKLNMLDLLIVHDEFGRDNCYTKLCRGDVNRDGKVNDHDKELIKAALKSARTVEPTSGSRNKELTDYSDNASMIESAAHKDHLPAEEHRSLIFQNRDNATVIDTRTNLMWTRDANPVGETLLFYKALLYIQDMNAGKYQNFGYSDWRLPEFQELYGLLDYTTYRITGHDLPEGHPFKNIKSIKSRRLTDSYLSNASSPLLFSCYCRLVGRNSQSCFGYVWPVRDNR